MMIRKFLSYVIKDVKKSLAFVSPVQQYCSSPYSKTISKSSLALHNVTAGNIQLSKQRFGVIMSTSAFHTTRCMEKHRKLSNRTLIRVQRPTHHGHEEEERAMTYGEALELARELKLDLVATNEEEGIFSLCKPAASEHKQQKQERLQETEHEGDSDRVKREKRMEITNKIQEHEFALRLKSIAKWLAHQHPVNITIVKASRRTSSDGLAQRIHDIASKADTNINMNTASNGNIRIVITHKAKNN